MGEKWDAINKLYDESEDHVRAIDKLEADMSEVFVAIQQWQQKLDLVEAKADQALSELSQSLNVIENFSPVVGSTYANEQIAVIPSIEPEVKQKVCALLQMISSTSKDGALWSTNMSKSLEWVHGTAEEALVLLTRGKP